MTGFLLDVGKIVPQALRPSDDQIGSICGDTNGFDIRAKLDRTRTQLFGPYLDLTRPAARDREGPAPTRNQQFRHARPLQNASDQLQVLVFKSSFAK
jgi:hypothetical protein